MQEICSNCGQEITGKGTCACQQSMTDSEVHTKEQFQKQEPSEQNNMITQASDDQNIDDDTCACQQSMTDSEIHTKEQLQKQEPSEQNNINTSASDDHITNDGTCACQQFHTDSEIHTKAQLQKQEPSEQNNISTSASDGQNINDGTCVSQQSRLDTEIRTKEQCQKQELPEQNNIIIPSSDDQKFDEYMKKTSAFLGSAFSFFKVFIRQPVTAMQKCNIKMSEAMFFVLLQSLALFLLISVILGSISRSLGSSLGLFYGLLPNVFVANYFLIFFKIIIFEFIGFFALTAISILFGKVIFKGSFSFYKLLTLTAVAGIPFTAAIVISIILFFISVQLMTLALTIGVISTIVLGTYVFSAAFDLSPDRCVYSSIFTYVLQSVILSQILINIVR
ncbi:MAG TPA: hypothetical protein VF941_16380, partial [Clostridia bacterium]